MLERKLVGMAPAARLSLMRIILCAAALCVVIAVPLSEFSTVSPLWFKPVGILQWIPAHLYQALLASSERLLGFQSILIVFLLLGAAGIMTRFSIFIAAVLFTFFTGFLRSYGSLFNGGFILIYLLFALSLLPCGDALSFDARRRKNAPGEDLQPDLHYAWGAFLLRAILAFCCLMAAYAKIYHAGLSWLEPSNLKNFLLQDLLNYNSLSGTVFGNVFYMPKLIWFFLSAAVFLSEALFALILLSWHFRSSFAFFVIAVQAALVLLCPPLVLDALCMSFLTLICFDWDRILLTRRLPLQDRRRRGF